MGVCQALLQPQPVTAESIASSKPGSKPHTLKPWRDHTRHERTRRDERRRAGGDQLKLAGGGVGRGKWRPKR